MRRVTGLTAFAVFALVLASQPARAQRPEPKLPVYGHTLMQGSGYISTPYAMVNRSSLFVTGTAIVPDAYQASTATPPDDYTVTRLAAGISLARFLEVGITGGAVDAFSLFGKLQLVKQQGIWPSIAVGAMNLTTFNLGRYGIEDDYYDDPLDASSFYGVFTYVVGPGRTSFPSWITISGGWGTGLFLKNNPQIEDTGRSGGVFGAVTLDFQAGDNAFIRFIGEWDGFDLNLGAVADLAGLEVSGGILSATRGGAVQPPAPNDPFDPTKTFPGSFYNQVKPYFSITLDLRALGAIPWIWTKEEEKP